MPFIIFLLTLAGTFLPVAFLYLLDKKFCLKGKLISQFSTIRVYKVTLLASSLTLYILYITLLYFLGSSLFFTGFFIIFLYHYLMYKPERYLDSVEQILQGKDEYHETH